MKLATMLGLTLILISFFIYDEVLGPSSAQAEDFCCTITAIDLATGRVTATETSTGKIFQFKKIVSGVSPNLRAVSRGELEFLKSLKAGQIISVDFKSRRVSINSNDRCCVMVQSTPDIPLKKVLPLPPR